MEYRRLGKAGLKVSELSFGSWITFGSNLNLNSVRQCLRMAFDAGINFFDNAEAYASGASELLMGEAIKDFRREDLVISTKIFWGGKGANAVGLNWKHLVEGTKGSLRRLQLDYVDLLFCHRPDPTTPIEETVRAMDVLVRSGYAFYWGTSEWRAADIEEAHQIAREIHAVPPAMEQPEYNMFQRTRVEEEYASLYHKYGMGITTWSPLESGILTGKYNEEIPPESRLYRHEELRNRLTKEKISKIKSLEKIAQELSCRLSQLAIAWCLRKPNVSSVIIGASSLAQLQENLEAERVKILLTNEVMQKIENVLQSCTKGDE